MKISIVALVLCVAFGTARAAEPAPTLRRFALIVSSNDGGRDRVPLRFADSDGRSMADVLRELGGLRAEDLLLVPNASRAAIHASFERLRQMMGTAGAAERGGPRREVVLYYSGHSDEDGLLVRGERVQYRELREWISGTDAEVRIAILDSCASGALIRQKGGTRAASFLGDRSVDARGHAFLTASSADEAAQESERIGAAFFTHYLVSGLRGAADTNRDGLVTLGEAYQFAYQETLHRTEHTSGGPQHPAYDIQLAGIGDLVLTDLRATTSSLVLDDALAGRIRVRDGQGRLVVELQKDAQRPVVLGLAPGAYTVALEQGPGVREARVTVRERASVRVAAAQLGAATLQPATARGGEPAPSAEPERAGTFFSQPSWRKLGGYAGVYMRYSRIGGEDGFNPGAELAISYRQLSLGVAGGAVITSRHEDGRQWTLGYGGFVARYTILFGDSPFYLSVGAIAAAGGYDISTEDTATRAVTTQEDNLWMFEPQLAGYVNLTHFARLGLDLGYRFVAAPGIDEKLGGASGGLRMEIGWF